MTIRNWWKRELLIAGRQRVLASLFLFWGPILLTILLLVGLAAYWTFVTPPR